MNCLESPVWPESGDMTPDCCCDLEATATFEMKGITVSAEQVGFGPLNGEDTHDRWASYEKRVETESDTSFSTYRLTRLYDEFGILTETGEYSFESEIHSGPGNVTRASETGEMNDQTCWNISWRYEHTEEGHPENNTLVEGSGWFGSIEDARLAGALLYGITWCYGTLGTDTATAREYTYDGEDGEYCHQLELLASKTSWDRDASGNGPIGSRIAVADLDGVPWGFVRSASLVWVPPVDEVCGWSAEDRAAVLAAYDEAVDNAEETLTEAQNVLADAETELGVAEGAMLSAETDFVAKKAAWASARADWCAASRAQEAACRRANYLTTSVAAAACTAAAAAVAGAASQLAAKTSDVVGAREALAEARVTLHERMEARDGAQKVVDGAAAALDAATAQSGAAHAESPSLQPGPIYDAAAPSAAIVPHYEDDDYSTSSMLLTKCVYRVKVVAGPWPEERQVRVKWQEINIYEDGSPWDAEARSAVVTFAPGDRVAYTTTFELSAPDSSVALTTGNLADQFPFIGSVSPAIASTGGEKRKRGFAVYQQANGDVPIIYRREDVSGGYPGCLEANRPARVYSGRHGVNSNGDSLGNTVSLDAREFHPQRISPFIDEAASVAMDWTSVSTTTKQWVVPDPCGVEGNDDVMTLTLSDEWSTGELSDAVSAMVLDNPDDWGVTPGIGPESAYAISELSPDQTYLAIRKIRPQFTLHRTWQPIDTTAFCSWTYTVVNVDMHTGEVTETTVSGSGSVAPGDYTYLSVGLEITAESHHLVYLKDFVDTTEPDPDDHTIGAIITEWAG